MYSTKSIHKNINPNYKQSYTSIGDPYRPSVERSPARYRSKQLVTQRCPRNADNGYFSKLTYHEEPYVEIAEKYSKTFPLEGRKLGFGSRDAMKRGEYTSTKATERLRETLKKETRAMGGRTGRRNKENIDGGSTCSSSSEAVSYPAPSRVASEPKARDGTTLHLPKFMYDVGRSNVTPFNPRHPKDRFYNIPRHADVISMQKSQGTQDDIRRLGSFRPTSASIGQSAWKHVYAKPEYGRKK